MKPQVSVIVLAYNEGEAIVPCLERILTSVELPCEVLVVYDSPEDTTVPWIEKCQRADPRVVPCSTSTARVRRVRSDSDLRKPPPMSPW